MSRVAVSLVRFEATTHGRQVLLVAVTIALAAFGLTGWTFQRWLASYGTLQSISIALLEVSRASPDSRHVDASVRFGNDGELPVVLEQAMLLLYQGRRLVAVANRDLGLLLPPAGTVHMSIRLSTDLGSEVPDASLPGWSLQAYAVLRYPGNPAPFRIRLRSDPKQ